jgi:hypothetical protein
MEICLQAESNLKHTLARKEGQTTALKLPSSHCFQVRAIDPVKLASRLPGSSQLAPILGIFRASVALATATIQQVLVGIIPTAPPLASIPNAYHSHFLICQLPLWCVCYCQKKGIKSHSRTEVSLFCLMLLPFIVGNPQQICLALLRF